MFPCLKKDADFKTKYIYHANKVFIDACFVECFFLESGMGLKIC